jgi:uncharacterized protein YnzC (UPF0291/DUF896 family)
VITSQTKEERAADRAAFDKSAKKKLSALSKKEKKGTITDAEKTELAALRALSGRVAAARSALKHKDLEEVLAAAGTDVAGWYGVLQTGKFLNQSVHVHPALAARLAAPSPRSSRTPRSTRRSWTRRAWARNWSTRWPTCGSRSRRPAAPA